jgi:collagenase-like PrtC family protease
MGTRKAELLLPAGNTECLKAAVLNGADAVYLGMQAFNAREFAGNFSLSELKKAISYAHENGVKVYVTFNTLVKDSEVKIFLDSINDAYSAGCDAIIIQDYWLLPIINANFPDLDIHLSTQASVMNHNSISFIEKLGKFSRVILARELSKQEISLIKANTSKDIEIFVHGALCMCYSGQCLFSSIIGGRSGNRGKCAQPCRKMYNSSYQLSTKELCLIEHIPEIITSGVSCVKVEGRMRSPLYISIVARTYRKAIDSFYDNKTFVLDDESRKELELAFNREFTDDYFTQRDTEKIISHEKPMNRGIYLGEYKDNVKLLQSIQKGDGYCIWDKENKGSIIKKIILKSKEVDSAAKGDIVNLGFTLNEKRKIYLTSSKAIEEKYSLQAALPKRNKIEVERNKKEISVPVTKAVKNKDNPKFLVCVKDLKEAESALSVGADIVAAEIYSKDISEIKDKCIGKSKFFLKTKNIANDKIIEEDTALISKIKPDGLLVGNIGYLNKFSSSEIILDYNLNIFNSCSFSEVRKRGYNAVISLELNFDELTQIKDKSYFVYAHGDLCIASTKIKINDSLLKDEIGAEFPVTYDGYVSRIFNCKEIGFFDNVKKLNDNGIKNYVINTRKDISSTLKTYKLILEGHASKYDVKKYTYGHLKRGV